MADHVRRRWAREGARAGSIDDTVRRDGATRRPPPLQTSATIRGQTPLKSGARDSRFSRSPTPMTSAPDASARIRFALTWALAACHVRPTPGSVARANAAQDGRASRHPEDRRPRPLPHRHSRARPDARRVERARRARRRHGHATGRSTRSGATSARSRRRIPIASSSSRRSIHSGSTSRTSSRRRSRSSAPTSPPARRG